MSSPSHDRNVANRRFLQYVQRSRGKIRVEEALRSLGQDPSTIEGDIAMSNDNYIIIIVVVGSLLLQRLPHNRSNIRIVRVACIIGRGRTVYVCI